MKKLLLTIMSICILGMLSGCNEVEELNDKIENIIASKEITQEQFDEVFSEYENLSDKQKERIENFGQIEKYKNVDIERINEINEVIKDIDRNTSFNELLELKESIEQLNSNEKALVNNSKIDEAIKLNDIEKAAVVASQYVIKSLKSSESFELQSAKVINDLEGDSKYYLVKLEYSAANSFDTQIDDESFQTINNKFENPWWGLALLGGNYKDALNCTSFIQYYLTNNQSPTELDCDKIMYYIDEKIN